MTIKTATRTDTRRGVYKLRYAGVVYYRLGYGPEDARRSLARELRAKVEVSIP